MSRFATSNDTTIKQLKSDAKANLFFCKRNIIRMSLETFNILLYNKTKIVFWTFDQKTWLIVVSIWFEFFFSVLIHNNKPRVHQAK